MSQHEEMVAKAKKVVVAEGRALDLDEAARSKLEKSGVHIFYGELAKEVYSLREVARICDMAEAWVRVQLKKGNIAGSKVKIGRKAIWQVTRPVLAALRQEQVNKHLNRIEQSGKGKKYTYRRPTEWAYHLTVKAIKADAKLTKADKTKFLNAMNRYQTAWERAYKERKAKKEAKAANNG